MTDFHTSRQRQAKLSTTGSALLIVLAFIVIMSVILLAYMARTQLALRTSDSSASIVEANLLAETAEAAILSDIRQEMLAGSTNLIAPTNGMPLVVTNSWAMVPGRVLKNTNDLSNTNFVNLVKQSAYNRPFFPGNNPSEAYKNNGPARAINVSTATSSKNGRIISAARWNQPYLLGGAGFTATNQLPDWILITRDGVATNSTTGADFQKKNPAASSSKQFVIGRFAYNIYNIGGLLDINVAGFSSDAAHDAVDKGSMAWSDLSVIPGILNVDALVDWRNKSSKSDYLAMVQGREINNTNSLPQPWGESGGFQKPYTTNGVSDNRFFTRQDLLKYVKSHPTPGLNTNALSYLTTFSADVDQPSISPHPDRPRVERDRAVGGNDAKGQDDDINPTFLTVLTPERTPLVERRFPLDRLKYVFPSPSEAAKVKDYFGLEWDSSEDAWIYSTDGNATKIKTLSEISGRKPNFIELLKAAITVGSLGGQFQNTSPPEPPGSPRMLAGGRLGYIDNQIIQIAANIIDQYDTDSYPTRIQFDGNTFYGGENLPYLYLIRSAPYRIGMVDLNDLTVPIPATPEPVDDPPVIYRCVMILQPTLWNPHAPPVNDSPFDGPTQFRITAKSGLDVYAGVRESWANPGDYVSYFPSSNPIDHSLPFPPVIQFDKNTNYLTFNTMETGKAAFREPYTLTSPNFPLGSNAAGYTVETVLPGEELNEEFDGTKTPSPQVIGFKVGNIWGGPSTLENTQNYRWFRGSRVFGNGIDFELQYRTRGGGWATYDEFPAFSASNPAWHDFPVGVVNYGRPIMRFSMKIDPRTDRYGPRDGNNYVHKSGTRDYYRHWFQGWTAWAANPYPGAYGAETELRFGKFSNGNSSTPLANINWTAGGTYLFWALIARNDPNDAVHYEDADGVSRLGMAGAFTGSGRIGLPYITGNMASRPVILNRPFRSVAELGYAFRGQPWKQLDFWTPASADAALLDVFCISEPVDDEAKPIVRGRIDLNTRNSIPIQAMLMGVAKADGIKLSETEAAQIATKLSEWTKSSQAGKGPLKNRSELVGKYDPAIAGINEKKFSGFSSEISAALATTDDRTLQIRRQNVLRALVDGGTARTWTFLIDVIVQEGRFPENTTSTQIDQFLVQGEQRYWIQVSIDRFTGNIVSKLVESVDE